MEMIGEAKTALQPTQSVSGVSGENCTIVASGNRCNDLGHLRHTTLPPNKLSNFSSSVFRFRLVHENRAIIIIVSVNVIYKSGDLHRLRHFAAGAYQRLTRKNVTAALNNLHRRSFPSPFCKSMCRKTRGQNMRIQNLHHKNPLAVIARGP
ncbi:hypothetical protein RRG08_056481 [Elysia crispata]|uniref:Uncharacterized protein n=1 Tax=Elysia crispata TaxID=231223 RepID=A0AAE0XT24_9GAST|nr:hypothetical protein RRG08_056481 [Elysia crispata]